MENPEKDHQNTNPFLNYAPSSGPSKEVAAEDTEDKKENWLVYYTPTGIEYFYNVITKQSTYEKPDCLKTNIEKELSVFNWKEFATNEGIPYWYNTQTKESSWNKPQELIDYEAKLHKKPKAPVEKKEEDPKMILNNEYTKLLEQLFGLYSVEEVQQHFFQLLEEKNNQQDQIQQDIRYYLPKNEKQRQYYDQQYQIKTRSNKNKSIFEVVEIKNELTHYVMEHQFPIKTSSYKDLQSFIQSNQLWTQLTPSQQYQFYNELLQLNPSFEVPSYYQTILDYKAILSSLPIEERTSFYEIQQHYSTKLTPVDQQYYFREYKQQLLKDKQSQFQESLHQTASLINQQFQQYALDSIILPFQNLPFSSIKAQLFKDKILPLKEEFLPYIDIENEYKLFLHRYELSIQYCQQIFDNRLQYYDLSLTKDSTLDSIEELLSSKEESIQINDEPSKKSSSSFLSLRWKQIKSILSPSVCFYIASYYKTKIQELQEKDNEQIFIHMLDDVFSKEKHLQYPFEKAEKKLSQTLEWNNVPDPKTRKELYLIHLDHLRKQYSLPE